jgi:uncharacterized protein YndB with AHSA1/START domain
MRLNGTVAQISRSCTVAAPPQRVWDVLADFGALSSWAVNVDHSCMLEHRGAGPAVGTTRRVQVGRNTLVERITEFEVPDLLAYEIEGLPRLVGRMRNRWTLECFPGSLPAGDSTAVTLTTTVDIGASPLAGAAEHVMCRIMARQSAAMLAGLAARVEGSL